MRYRFLIFLLLVSFSACSFDVEVITPDAALGTATLTLIVTPDTQRTPTAAPTSEPSAEVLAPFPAFTSTASPRDLGIFPIRFEPNATYTDIVDTILGGTSKTYSIRALQGQVMSVSVRQSLEGDWVYIPIKIVGADGATLCPPDADNECTFWRGVLPATQDYFVTLSPAGDALDFALRVAINPPGAESQSFTAQSQNQSVSFSYSDEFAPVRFSGAEVTKTMPEITLEYVNTDSYRNTNLVEAYFLFGETEEAEVVARCTEPASLGGPETMVGETSIRGIPFIHSEAGGVAAGNIYEQTYYRAVHNGTCYEFTFFVHYANIGVYAPDSGVKEFDRAALMQKFDAILFSLIIK